MKIFHTADWHLGAQNQPSEYKELALPKLCEEARVRGINTVLVAGDVFDKPSPNQVTKDYLLSILTGYPDINFIFTPGNHDYADKTKSYHSLNTYALLGPFLHNVKVCYEGCSCFDEFNIIVLPDNVLKYDTPTVDNGRKNIVVWHGVLPGSVVERMDFSGCSKFATEVMEHFNAVYFALGDIHRPVKILDTCWYPGALTQKTYGCVRGLREVDTETGESEEVELNLPSRVSISIKGAVDEDTLIHRIRKKVVEGSLLKVKFNLPLSAWSSVNKKKIKEELIGSYKEVVLCNDPAPENTSKRKNIDKFSSARTIREELRIIVDTNDYQNKVEVLSNCTGYFKGEKKNGL